MPQIFNPSTNTLSRVSIFGAVVLLALAAWVFATLNRSSYATRQGLILAQPVPFSHDHHVSAIGIDCRYCHTAVEQSSAAGIPPTATCMTCHSQIWAQSPMLEPVRASFASGAPIAWTRIHDLPGFAYFNHSIHVAKGIGCATCHGRIDRMALTWQASTMQMEWCLECHRDPARFVQPRETVFSPTWQPPGNATDEAALRAELARSYRLKSKMSCSTCHR